MGGLHEATVRDVVQYSVINLMEHQNPIFELVLDS